VYLVRTIATVGGIGYLPFVPGTAGSAVGLGIAWILCASPLQQIIGCLVVIGLALWSAGPTARAMGQTDPRSIVIDEVAGMMVAVATLPVGGPLYLAGFLIFRFLDVAKPPPIRQLERLPGSWGILLDDLLAGLMTNLILRALFSWVR